jgi:hypothetical protein
MILLRDPGWPPNSTQHPHGLKTIVGVCVPLDDHWWSLATDRKHVLTGFANADIIGLLYRVCGASLIAATFRTAFVNAFIS